MVYRGLRFAILSIVLLASITASLLADWPAGYPSVKKILVITTSVADTRTTLYELINDQYSVCRPVPSVNGNGYHDGAFNQVFTFVPSAYDQAINPLTACGGPCDQVWDMRFDTSDQDKVTPCNNTRALGPNQATELRNFMASSSGAIPPGRTVFLLGDNTGFTACRNQGVIDFVNSVVASGTFAPSGSGYLNLNDGYAYINLPEAIAAENFNSDPRCITCCATNGQVWAQFAGGIKLTELATGRPVYLADNVQWPGVTITAAVGVAFQYNDLKTPYNFSKLFTWWDWQTQKNTPTSRCCLSPYDSQNNNMANSTLIQNAMDYLVIIPTPTPTPSPTSTNTTGPTATFTATNTLTFTQTPTLTPTFTNTATNTPSFTGTFTNTVTNTPTNTPTNTATNTFTLTNTPTNTFTNTPTNSATASSTSTLTWTPTNTSTSTDTFTQTFTRTSTPTNTATNTPTNTFTVTNTVSPTFTGTPTDTYTQTFTRTSTPTNTATNTPTTTNTPTNTFTVTNTVSPTNTSTHTDTGTNTPTWTQTNTQTGTNSPTTTNTPTGTFTVTNTVSPTNTNTPSNTGTNTPTWTNTDTFTETNTPTNTVSPTDTYTVTNTVSPTDTYTVTNTVSPTDTGTATYTRTVTQTFTATNTPTNTVSPTDTYTVTNTVSPTDTRTPTNTYTWTNTVTATNTYTETYTHTYTNTPTMTFTHTNTPTVTNTQTPLPPHVDAAMFSDTASGALGSLVTVSIVLQNTGGGVARDVAIWDTLPTGVSFRAAESGPGWSVSGSIISYTAGDILPGATVTLQFVVEIMVEKTATGNILIAGATAGYRGDPDPTGVFSQYANSNDLFIVIGNILIYPNPYNVALGGTMKFLNLPKDSKVIIYTISGEAVMQYSAITKSNVEWDGRNAAKSKVSAGIYYFVVRDRDNNVVIKDRLFVVGSNGK